MINRYKSILNTKKVSDIPSNISIKERSTDIFVKYNPHNRLDLMANKFYSKPELYWLILEANDYSLEFDIPFGSIIRIPYPLESVIEEIRSKV